MTVRVIAVRSAFHCFTLLLLLFAPCFASAQSICAPLDNIPGGLHFLRFEDAWKKNCGTASVAVIDNGVYAPGGSLHSRLNRVRPQMSATCSTRPCGIGGEIDEDERGLGLKVKGHGTHVAGIIGGTADASQPPQVTVGGCRGCSLYIFRSGTDAGASESIRLATAAGASVINMSQATTESLACVGTPNGMVGGVCPDYRKTLDAALGRDIAIVAASGNTDKSELNGAVGWPANYPNVIAVGGLSVQDDIGSFWSPTGPYISAFDNSSIPLFGSVSGPQQFVIAPATQVRSTFYYGQRWAVWSNRDEHSCRDFSVNPADPVVVSPGSGFGICTGTSMSAPHVAAIVALMKSANPLLSLADVRSYLQQSSTQLKDAAGNLLYPFNQQGYGYPNAAKALDLALGSPGAINRVTPLFGFTTGGGDGNFYRDHLYTVYPQAALAAMEGTMPPGNTAMFPIGSAVPGYAAFPCRNCIFTPGTPLGVASVYTTHRNPDLSSNELSPLYRLSRVCVLEKDPGCRPGKTAHVYVSDDPGTPDVNSELTQWRNAGWQIDSIEGFVVPKGYAAASGHVKLCRKFNPTTYDFILFPGNGNGINACDVIPSPYNEGAYSYMPNGYPDWVGYVPVLMQPKSVQDTSIAVPTTLEIVGGNNQNGTVNHQFRYALQARLLDQYGQPVQQKVVYFDAPYTAGATATITPSSQMTDVNGVATVTATANGVPGTYTVSVVSNLITAPKIVLTNQNAVPATFRPVSGLNQVASTNAPFPNPFTVQLLDQNGNPMPGVVVTITPRPGASGASATPSSSTVVIDANGYASFTATANAIAGDYVIDAAIAGAPTLFFPVSNVQTLAFVNGGFESPQYGYSGAANGWGGNGTVLTNEWLSARTYPLAPEGRQVVGFYGGGAINQVLGLGVGRYQIRWRSMLSRDYGASNIRLRINGVEYDAFVPSNAGWSDRFINVTLSSAGSYNFEFASDATSSLLFLDNITIVTVPPDSDFYNGSFEAPQVGPNGGGAPYGWAGGPTIMENTALTARGMGPAPSGTQVAYYNSGSSIWQTLTLGPGTYTVHFKAATYPFYPGVLRVIIDGVLRDAFVPPTNWWMPRSVTFSVPGLSDHTIQFASDPAVWSFEFVDEVYLTSP